MGYGITDEIQRKLEILADAAKYDVACTSSGVSRKGKKVGIGNTVSGGICHAFSRDGRCISLLKILLSNDCIYDCAYCVNRRSNDNPRASFSPEEICRLTIEFYRRNYIEGLFLSSAVRKNPDDTMELIYETVKKLREEYRFHGYIHVKAIPGASKELIYSAGLLADRISINMELPTQDSLSKLAPNKHMANIIRPMNQISGTIAMHRLAIGKSARMERAGINDHLMNRIWGKEVNRIGTDATDRANRLLPGLQTDADAFLFPADKKDLKLGRAFVPAGQSTQMIIGATNETDLELIRTTQNLYKSFDLKRVFYSGYIPVNEDDALPEPGTPVPLLREHRLYQADWLLRYYGFFADELLSEEHPFFDDAIDPKCNWALNHLEQFPIEINTASYDMLLRVPGIGPNGVKKIVNARRYTKVDFEMLKQMRITLKRAQYFITCNGKMLYKIPLEHRFIRNRLIDVDSVEIADIGGQSVQYKQMNLFSDFNMSCTG